MLNLTQTDFQVLAPKRPDPIAITCMCVYRDYDFNNNIVDCNIKTIDINAPVVTEVAVEGSLVDVPVQKVMIMHYT